MSGTFAVIVPPAGPARIEPWPAGGDVGHLLAQLYAWIGTRTVDSARLDLAPGEDGERHHLTAWIDDEGLFAQPVAWNDRATVLAHAAGHFTDGLAGTVVLSGGVDDDGNSLGLPRDIADALLAAMPVLGLLDPNGGRW